MTPRWINELYNKVKGKGNVYDLIMNGIVKKDKKGVTADVLNTFVSAFMYEPAIEFGQKDKPTSYKYIFDPPTNLPKYLEHFAQPNKSIQIEAGPELFQCIGIEGVNKAHSCLKAEGSSNCIKCQHIFCSTCGYDPRKDRGGKQKKCKFSKSFFDNKDEPLCMECYKTQLFLPLGGDMTLMSTREMINVLKDNNHQIEDDTPANVVQEMYDIHLLGNTNHDELVKQIKFPKYEANSMNDPFLVLGEKIMTAELVDGGRFISDTVNLADKDVPQMLELIAAFVKVNPGYSHCDFEKGIFDVMPSMLVDFANGCRVDSGYRLLERCLRHAFDNKAETILNKEVTFIRTKNGNIGITINNHIPASMRDKIYDVEACVTKNELLACRCNCQSGGQEKEKVVCVHVLPVLYQFTMLLHEGLAQHILVELCQRWNSCLEDLVKSEIDMVKNNIAILMRAEGASVDAVALATLKGTVGEMLKTFAVGTDIAKLAIPRKPDPNELIPLRKLRLESLASKAKEIVSPKRKKRCRVAMDNSAGTSIRVLKKDHGTDTLIPIRCDFCNGSALTRHVCRFPGGNRKIEGVEKLICGLATCISCLDKDCEDRCLCNLHKDRNDIAREPMDEEDSRGKDDMNIQTFEPNYADAYLTCMSIPDFDFDDFDFPGFKLLKIRAKETAQQMGINMVTTVLKEKEKMWKSDLELLTKRRRKMNKMYHGRKRKNPLAPLKQEKSLSPRVSEGCKLVEKERIRSFTRGPRRKCCFAGCKTTDKDKDFVRMKLVKSKPKRSFDEMNASGEKVDSIKRVMYNHYLRYYTLDRCGMKDEGRDYFLCDQHELERRQ